MTYIYVCHRRNLSPMIRIIWYAHSEYTLQHATAACRLKSPFYTTPANTSINFILIETRVPELHDGCYRPNVSICISLYALFSKAKKRCSRRALTRDPLSFNVFFLKNPSEYPHKPYIVRNYSPRPAEDSRRWQYVSIFIRLHAIIFRKSHGRSQPNRRENRTESEIAIQGHSRSYILGSLKSWRRTAYRYIITRQSGSHL